MAFTNDPTLARDRVRMIVGDVDGLNCLVDDEWYEYFLKERNLTESRTALEIAKAILARYTANTREVVDQVEVYGNQEFNQYLQWLEKFISDPSLSGMGAPMPYAGGISKSDMRANNRNRDNHNPASKVSHERGHRGDLEIFPDFKLHRDW
jgi:hypothetical protein